MEAHKPVLFDEVMEGLAIRPDGIYVDGTFGRGGHSFGILQRLGPNGRLMAMDKDPDAVAVENKALFEDARLSIVHETFANLQKAVRDRGWEGKVNGILLDIGVSSPQLEDAKRGFSFSKDGPLDMRMNPKQSMDAASWINQAAMEDIRRVLWNYGEERFAKRIAQAIVNAREEKPITRTQELSDIVIKAYPQREIKKHPATRTFQAIRIFINRELDELRECLPQCLETLAVGGRLCVISFHSLEDRLVKRFIQKESRDHLPREIPILAKDIKHRLKPLGSLIRPTEAEIKKNPRARSARLRIVEKLS
ncbi:16S rRNA (cytosine(1402)-N(4))-methyltransferase RsmH [Coxiella burnetii]|uniref:Ribosomal RNA small subunit methyltransferase H n=1 Tax=Coxiella burnetii (strain CbuG_Q212) TaxID=434923 RepID=RSMH_COXB2|nr:16S rRNA (cytosine(1402)-N(4))-methyltransferase RsmH [Coxiella burnetii]B6J2R7.1 RecName: Full=Ribosomal RNA small subunit methyltransferase H; AltName: Full=16S rRNA m(4)C1402 methyltransferase; AltName: Full=rRNA (cytosine-N(4)-)-methyltransferase RsmH [Coxiella burnetii CbuG_Q212]ACJ19144.1 S-adenosyl-methyltransferase [Coxiella burnetii CbuG_Q212]ATN67484.1 ribosomal RNA small subunit methyltransferase H [Coxiella burnetii]OYK85674.1 ribosomal RNA small subunit methyltransferase H [Coxi